MENSKRQTRRGNLIRIEEKEGGQYVKAEILDKVAREVRGLIDAWDGCGGCANEKMTVEMSAAIANARAMVKAIDDAFAAEG